MIRQAALGDEVTLANLCRSVHDFHAAARPDIFVLYDAAALAAWYRNLLAKDEVKFWIAEVDGRPAGFVSAAIKTREANPFCRACRWCEIDNLAVEPEFQRRGLARRLIETVAAHSKAFGIQIIELTTWWFNHDARTAYEKLGFQARNLRLERLETGEAGRS